MANEDTWVEGDILSEQPTQAAGRILTSNLWFTLLEFCRFVDTRALSLLHTPGTGFSSDAVKRPYSPCYPEPELPPSKRPKVGLSLWKSDRASSIGQLAFFPCSVIPTPNPNPKPVECLEDVRCLELDACEDYPRLRPQKCVETNVSSSSFKGVASLPMSPDERRKSGKWELQVVASSRCKSPSLLASDVIGTIDFNADGELYATGGIARKIRICSYAKMTSVDTERSPDEDDELYSDEDDEDLSENRHSCTRRTGSKSAGPTLDHGDCAVAEICTPGKLSSVKWRPDGSEVIGCGDYDGVVSEWDIEHKHTVSEWYEHSGQRVWSLDYSRLTPTLAASASGDGTVRLWNRGSERSVSAIRPPSRNSLCCAEFSPYSQYLIAIASADSNVYLYDLRNPDSSLQKLVGHEKAVSYVKFLSKDNIVSASVDSTLKLWDVSSRPAAGADDSRGVSGNIPNGHTERTFRDHLNLKNFVGLSVHRGSGILACGSETNEVFIYENSNTKPLQRHKLPSNSGPARHRGSRGNPFIGAVCWREHANDCSMVAANSEGVVQVLQAHKVDTV